MSFDDSNPQEIEMIKSTDSFGSPNFKVNDNLNLNLNLNLNKTLDISMKSKSLIDYKQNEEINIHKNIHKNKNKNNLFLTIGIELMDGHEEIIPVYKGETPRQVVNKFTSNHPLHKDIKEALIESVRKKIQYAEEHSSTIIDTAYNNEIEELSEEQTSKTNINYINNINKNNKNNKNSKNSKNKNTNLNSSCVQDIQIMPNEVNHNHNKLGDLLISNDHRNKNLCKDFSFSPTFACSVVSSPTEVKGSISNSNLNLNLNEGKINYPDYESIKSNIDNKVELIQDYGKKLTTKARTPNKKSKGKFQASKEFSFSKLPKFSKFSKRTKNFKHNEIHNFSENINPSNSYLNKSISTNTIKERDLNTYNNQNRKLNNLLLYTRSKATPEKCRNADINNLRKVENAMTKNVTNRLYNNAVKKKSQNEKISMEIKKLNDEKALEEITFKPETNKDYKFKNNRNDKKIENHLMISGKMSKLKIDNMRNTYFNNESIELPFKPKIAKTIDSSIQESKSNKNFETNIQTFKDTTDIYEQLFQEGEKKRALKSKINSMMNENLYSFTPKITDNSKIITKNKFIDNVTKRLTMASSNKNCNRLAIQNDVTYKKFEKNLTLNSNFNCNFNQSKNFKNCTGKSPIKKLESNNQIINNLENDFAPQKKLNFESIDNNNNKCKQDHIYKSMIDSESKLTTLLKSNQIFEEMKQRSINLIYTLLDYDCDNKISNGKMNVEEIPNEIRKIFSNLFSKIKDEELTLNKEEFANATKEMYNSLSIQDKGTLIRFCKQSKTLQKKIKQKALRPSFNFKPVIDEQSKKIVEKIRPIRTEMHEFFREKYTQCANKIDKLRILQSDKEISECTFKPNISKKEFKVMTKKPLFYY